MVRSEEHQQSEALSLLMKLLEDVRVEQDPLVYETLILIKRSQWRQWRRMRIHYKVSRRQL